MREDRALKVAIVGGGPACKNVMEMMLHEKLSHLRMELIGVACTNPMAAGYRYAQEKAIYTTSDYHNLYGLQDLGMIIELTGRDDLANEIARTKPEHVRLMDHVAARLFWDVFQLDQERRKERKRAQEELRDSAERYRTVLEASADPVVAYEMDGRVTYINPAFTKVFGWNTEELLGKKIDYVPQENWPETERLIERVLAGETFSGVTSRRYTKDGKILDVSISAATHVNQDGVPVGSVHVVRDITRQKRTEKAVRESEKKYSTLVENSLTGIYIDQDGKIVFANSRFAEIYGYAKDELMDMESWKLVHPQDRALTDEIRRKRLKGEGAPSEYEAKGLTKDGETIWIVRRNTRITFGGKPAILGNIVDITMRKKAEEALRASEEDWRKSFNALEDIMLIVDRDYTVRRINDRGLQLFRKSREEAVGEKCYRLIHGMEEPGDFCPFRKTLKTGKSALAVDRYERALDRYFSIKSSPIFDDSGQLTGFVDLMRDVTERRQAEEALRSAHEKLERRVQERTAGLTEANKALKEEIAERRRVEEERERLIRELRQALAKVKTLSGLLPICVSCKKIRDDKGYWNQLEAYIRDHSEADFSHGICPECRKRLYPEVFSDDDKS
jgi:PAS domain S-box-containing protein